MRADRHIIGSVLAYGAALAAGAFALGWLEYRYLTRLYPTEVYIVFLAVGFAALGVWVGHRLTADRRPKPDPFVRNDAALKSLGISPREFAVLELLATGQTNKQIARGLEVSPNTVKTHVARLFEKLDATRRTEAVGRARDLGLIP